MSSFLFCCSLLEERRTTSVFSQEPHEVRILVYILAAATIYEISHKRAKDDKWSTAEKGFFNTPDFLDDFE
jgi:hypothetical protein